MKWRNSRAVVPALLVSAGLLAFVACAPPVAQESAEIAARSAAWAKAFNAEDVDALVEFYTADARILAPNAPMAEGSAAVRAVFEEMIAAGLSGELKSVEAMAVGDLGHNVGTYSLSAAGEEVDRGKYIEVWRKVGGEWKIDADMFSSDLPAASEPQGATLVFTHEVEDGAHWLAAWKGEDSRHAMFATAGAPKVRTLQSPDNPQLTGLIVTVTDTDALMALLNSPEGVAAKDEDGVRDQTLKVLAEVE